MASISYLWKNRKKVSFFSILFFRIWAKRLITFKELIVRNRARIKLSRKGALISLTAEIGRIKCNGKIEKLYVGDNSFIGSNVEFALHEAITIGKNVCINDGVILLTASHRLDDPEWSLKKAQITVNDFAWIATNAIILPGVTIGVGAVVGAGAVVSKNVGDYEIAVGNPARIISRKRIQQLDYNPCEFLAANMAWLKG